MVSEPRRSRANRLVNPQISNKELRKEKHFVRREVLDDGSPTSANLGNDHRFISEEY